MKTSANTPWTDAELGDSVDAYVFMLRAQAAGLIFRGEAVAAGMLEEGLADRNEASLRYRLRNISAVVQEMGGPVLEGYSPAEQVGSGVRQRIRALLLAHPYFNRVADTRLAAGVRISEGASDPRTVALDALAELRRQIDDIERDLFGIGHNKPPEPISPVPLRRAAFDEAREDITALELEMGKPQVNPQVVAARSEKLLQFGVKILMWVGQRTTKFVDAALIALAPAVVVKVTGLLPLLIEALSAVERVARY
ncbi:MAG TPA: hypothetical protein VF138_12395 [Caulobacteraceae bacterium]